MDKPHKKLDAWNRAMELVKVIYALTTKFPKEEQYGLVSQMRRAAVSVVSNIAEGSARNSRPDYARFVNMAMGSISELDTQLDLAAELGFMSQNERKELDNLLIAVDRMLIGLWKYLRSDEEKPDDDE